VPIDGHVCGLGQVKHREFAMAAGEMSPAEFIAFLETVLGNLSAHSGDGSIHFICMDWRHIGELLLAADLNYRELKNVCVWNKTNGGMGSLYRSKHELVFVFKAGTAPHINNVALGKHGRYRTNVWDYPGVNSLKAGRLEELALHPTVKPVALVADAILDCSNRGGLVLDCFLGSGTTLIAAEKTGRRAAGMELDPARGYRPAAVAGLHWRGGDSRRKRPQLRCRGRCPAGGDPWMNTRSVTASRRSTPGFGRATREIRRAAREGVSRAQPM
jgi:hypothetical protein